MDRTTLYAWHEQCGGDKELLRQRLMEYFKTPEGQKAIDEAPPSLIYDGSGRKSDKTTDIVVALLLQEFT